MNSAMQRLPSAGPGQTATARRPSGPNSAAIVFVIPISAWFFRMISTGWNGSQDYDPIVFAIRDRTGLVLSVNVFLAFLWHHRLIQNFPDTLSNIQVLTPANIPAPDLKPSVRGA